MLTSVTIRTDPTSSSPAYQYVGLWADIRGFLAKRIAKGFTFSDIEIEFHKGDHLVSFDIDTSEMDLSLAQFNAVKKL
jgi:hypothetical protein